MSKTKINELKEILDRAHKNYEEEKARLVSLGLKSKERYELLKPLKAIENAANTAYVSFANKEVIKIFDQINAECIKEQRTKKEARRSARFAK